MKLYLRVYLSDDVRQTVYEHGSIWHLWFCYLKHEQKVSIFWSFLHLCISFEQDFVGNKLNILHVFTKQFYTSSRMRNTQKVKRVNKFRPKVEFNIFELLPRHPEYHMCHIYIIWISKYLGMLHMPCIEVWYIAYRFLKDERKITFMLEEDTSRW